MEAGADPAAGAILPAASIPIRRAARASSITLETAFFR